MTIIWSIIVFINGTVLGSFYNVIGLRMPQRISFVIGRSRCPNCRQTLQWFELIPILSYLFQKGSCRTCKMNIPPIYPFIELLTGVLFLFSYIKIGFQIELISALILISMSMIIYVSDIKYFIIPDQLLLFLLPIFIILKFITPLTPWYDSIVGALAGFGLVALIILASKGGMGAGDMKLLAVFGIMLGLKKVLLTFFIAALLGSIIGGILLGMKKLNRKEPIPFAPYLIVGMIISYFYGNELINLYFSFYHWYI